MTSSIVHPFREGHAHRTTFGYLTETNPRLDRMQNGISAFCGVIAALCILAITALTLAEVVTRFLFDEPFGWNISFIETYLMSGAAFFGMVTAYRSGAHVAVAGLYNHVPLRGRKPLLVLSYFLVAGGIFMVSWSMLNRAIFTFQVGEQPLPGASELGIPTWVAFASIVIAGVLGLVVVLTDLVREIMSPWNAPATDYDPGDGHEVPAEVVAEINLDGGVK